jgi:hypothetical protein
MDGFLIFLAYDEPTLKMRLLPLWGTRSRPFFGVSGAMFLGHLPSSSKSTKF